MSLRTHYPSCSRRPAYRTTIAFFRAFRWHVDVEVTRAAQKLPDPLACDCMCDFTLRSGFGKTFSVIVHRFSSFVVAVLHMSLRSRTVVLCETSISGMIILQQLQGRKLMTVYQKVHIKVGYLQMWHCECQVYWRGAALSAIRFWRLKSFKKKKVTPSTILPSTTAFAELSKKTEAEKIEFKKRPHSWTFRIWRTSFKSKASHNSSDPR